MPSSAESCSRRRRLPLLRDDARPDDHRLGGRRRGRRRPATARRVRRGRQLAIGRGVIDPARVASCAVVGASVGGGRHRGRRASCPFATHAVGRRTRHGRRRREPEQPTAASSERPPDGRRWLRGRPAHSRSWETARRRQNMSTMSAAGFATDRTWRRRPGRRGGRMLRRTFRNIDVTPEVGTAPMSCR